MSPIDLGKLLGSAGAGGPLRFVDRSDFYSVAHPFAFLSASDAAMLGLDPVERRIAFRPVATDPTRPVSVAFVGLNALCGTDYREAYRQPNFTVWAQDRYNSKLKILMRRYWEVADRPRGTSAAYFTNVVKFVLPSPQFDSAEEVGRALRAHDHLGQTFVAALRAEVFALISAGCRLFVCFGSEVRSFFFGSMGDRARVDIRTQPETPGIISLGVDGVPCLVVGERHFSRYTEAVTARFVEAVKAHTSGIRGRSGMGHRPPAGTGPDPS